MIDHTVGEIVPRILVVGVVTDEGHEVQELLARDATAPDVPAELLRHFLGVFRQDVALVDTLPEGLEEPFDFLTTGEVETVGKNGEKPFRQGAPFRGRRTRAAAGKQGVNRPEDEDRKR